MINCFNQSINPNNADNKSLCLQAGFSVKIFIILNISLILTSCNKPESYQTFKKQTSKIIAQEITKDQSNKITQDVNEIFEKHKKILRITKPTESKIIDLQHLPIEVLAINELKHSGEYTQSDLDSVIKSYGNVIYFDIKIRNKTGLSLYNEIKNKNSGNELELFLSEKFRQAIKLDKKHYPSVYHYNLSKGIFPGFSFFIGFQKDLIKKESTINLEQSLLTDKVELKLEPMHLAN